MFSQVKRTAVCLAVLSLISIFPTEIARAKSSDIYVSENGVAIPKHVLLNVRKTRLNYSTAIVTVTWVEKLSKSVVDSGKYVNPIKAFQYRAKMCRESNCQFHNIVDVTAVVSGYPGSTDSRFALFQGQIGENIGENTSRLQNFEVNLPFMTQIQKVQEGASGDWSAVSKSWDIFDDFSVAPTIDSSLPLFTPRLTTLYGNRITATLCFNPTRPELALEQGNVQLENYVIEFFVRRDKETIVSHKIIKPPDNGPDPGTHVNQAGCGGGFSYEANLFVAQKGISPGKIYEVGFTVTPPLSQSVTRVMRVMTPGVCPESADFENPDPTPSRYAFMSNDGFFDGEYYGTNENSFTAKLAARGQLAPVYEHYPTKTAPTNSYIWPAESFRYLQEIDDWELVVGDAKPIFDAELVKRTIFKDCAPSEVTVFKYAVPPDPRFPDRENLSCEVVQGVVVPKRIGSCILRVSFQRNSGVSSSGLRSRSVSSDILVAYYFSSIADTPNSNPQNLSTTTVVSKPSPTTNLKVNRTLSLASISKLTKLSSKSSSVASLSISKSSSRFCKVVNKTIKGLRPGSCHVTLTLRQKSGKKTVGLITVRISK
jgi:hypothetical protein